MIGFAAGQYYARKGMLPELHPHEEQLVSRSPHDVTALGRLEPTGGVIEIGGMQGERVAHVSVSEGSLVRTGDELARLASQPLYKAEYDQARARLTELEAQYRAAEVQGDAAIAEAELAVQQSGEAQRLQMETLNAQVALLRANFEVARRDVERLQSLGKDIVSVQQLDHARLLEKRASHELAAVELQQKQLSTTVRLEREQAEAKLKAVRAAKDQALASLTLDSARKAVDTTRLRSELSIIRAPCEGRVLSIMTRPGEAIAGAPLMKLGDLKRMLVRAEVFESDVHRVQPGQPVTVTSRALPEAIPGQVDSILWLVGRNSIRNLNPLSATDVRVVEVLIELDAAAVARHQELLARLVQLQVDVRIATGTPAGAQPQTAGSAGNERK